MPTFAEKLKELRKKAGLSQSGLSQKSGLSLGVIHDYEQAKKIPNLRSAFKLAEALGVSCEAFKDCIDAAPPEAPPATKKGKKK
jgi:transcriptional regulator with XRE-family HTH domain